MKLIFFPYKIRPTHVNDWNLRIASAKNILLGVSVGFPQWEETYYEPAEPDSSILILLDVGEFKLNLIIY